MIGSSSSTYAEDLRLALKTTGAPGAASGSLYRTSNLSAEIKSDLSPVTAADWAVESAVLTELARERPDDAVISEESGEQPGAAGRRWIVDPIDGTKSFMRGVPLWGTLLALEAAGEIVVGVVSAPALRGRWWASRDAGAWTSEIGDAGRVVRRTNVSSVSALTDAYISCSFDSLAEVAPDTLVTLLTTAWRARAFGDFWQHVLVAEGALDMAFDLDVCVWDVAPLKIIVEESGGQFTDLAGNANPGGTNALSTNGLVHDEALAILRRSAPHRVVTRDPVAAGTAPLDAEGRPPTVRHA